MMNKVKGNLFIRLTLLLLHSPCTKPSEWGYGCWTLACAGSWLPGSLGSTVVCAPACRPGSELKAAAAWHQLRTILRQRSQLSKPIPINAWHFIAKPFFYYMTLTSNFLKTTSINPGLAMLPHQTSSHQHHENNCTPTPPPPTHQLSSRTPSLTTSLTLCFLLYASINNILAFNLKLNELSWKGDQIYGFRNRLDWRDETVQPII